MEIFMEGLSHFGGVNCISSADAHQYTGDVVPATMLIGGVDQLIAGVAYCGL
jgi:hypothetical protein